MSRKIVYSHSMMSLVNVWMYEHTMSLANKASKNGDNETALKLNQEAIRYIEIANHHDLIGRVCGNEFVYG